MKQQEAIEVVMAVDSFKQQFDQGGILLRGSESRWIKTGVEMSDGKLWLSAVVANGDTSDWSTAQWPSEWEVDHPVSVRVSRFKDSIIVRIRNERIQGWKLLRVCSMPEDIELRAGPFSCSPTRDGLFCEFFEYSQVEGDEDIH